MKITLNSKVVIENPTNQIIAYCKENLIVPNPNYYKLQNMGKWTGNEPDIIYLYDIISEFSPVIYALPFGCIQDIWELYPNRDLYISDYSNRHTGYKENVTLRDYQEDAVEKIMQKKNGIAIAPCGSGKTVMGLTAIGRLHKKTLWLTHNRFIKPKQEIGSIVSWTCWKSNRRNQ